MNSKFSCFKKEKRFDLDDPTITIVDADDDLDFECEDFKSPKALMSCGHVVTPMSLTKWCLRLLEEGQSRFICGQTNCDAEWSYTEVRKMALLTPQEKSYFERNMTLNAARDLFGAKSCPGCKYSVVRKDLSNLSVHCRICTTKKGYIYEFCWQCMKEWKGPRPRSDHCGNYGCSNSSLDTLLTCGYAKFESVKGVTDCPSIRACPTCGTLVEHNGMQCKNIACRHCKVEFCFVCLKITTECKKAPNYDYYGPCSSGTAPRQTM